jgi:hypothetical protein
VDEVLSDIGEASSCGASAAIRDCRSGLLGVDVAVEVVVAPENLLDMPLSLIELGRDRVSDLTLSEGAGLLCLSGSVDVSLDRPGSPRLPDVTVSAGVASSLLFL